MTQADKFRKASKICWALGAFFTWSCMRILLAGSITEPAILWLVAIISALGVQYLLTLIEGKIIDGSLPAPWNVDFKNDTTVAFLACFAYFCFFIDISLNFAGVYSVTSRLGLAAGDVKQFGVTDYIINAVQFIATIGFSILFALGSELLDKMAERVTIYLDGGLDTENS